MRVVCDTNILVSGVLFGGNSRRVQRLSSIGAITNFISPFLLQEVESVLSRPKFSLSAFQVDEIVGTFIDTFEIVTPRINVQVIEEDPDDDRVLETAYQADAEYIISGDNHLLLLKQWQNIQIVSPSSFLTVMDR